MPLQQTAGNATSDAYGGGTAIEPVYIEQLFSTYLYTGTGADKTITNGIDLSTKGGLVWSKIRSAAGWHALADTARGATKILYSNSTVAQSTLAESVKSFTSTGYSIGSTYEVNNSGSNFVSWTFRKQPKFFDVVTYTGNGSTQVINHTLGSTPGCVIVKKANGVSGVGWVTYHRSTGVNKYLLLNAADAAADATAIFSDMTSTTFGVGNYSDINESGATYVAYLYAHDAGGFGLTGTDNVISCGSFTTDGSGNATVNLGYEPQWVMIKNTTSAESWYINDTMRGFPIPAANKYLIPNSSASEATGAGLAPTSTGFSNVAITASVTYIYIAIRRGPMKVPTDATKVFSPNAQTGAGTTAGQTLTTGFPVDLEISEGRSSNGGAYFLDRLRGGQNYITSASTAAEVNFTGYTPLISFANNTGILDANYGSTSNAYVAWNFRRAPSFFDEVCYTGTGSTRTISHNLQAVPELILFKKRSGAEVWCVYNATIGPTKSLVLNATSKEQNGAGAARFNDTAPTSSVFTVASDGEVNGSGATYVAYLFATCAGVSKVGSYTGTGATQTISCGFAGGARFVLVKRTDFAGDWYVWDTARGMVSGTDPSLLLNSTAAEVNANSIYTTTGGFQIVSTDAGINTSGGTYIFLAIA